MVDKCFHKFCLVQFAGVMIYTILGASLIVEVRHQLIRSFLLLLLLSDSWSVDWDRRCFLLFQANLLIVYVMVLGGACLLATYCVLGTLVEDSVNFSVFCLLNH